MTLRWEDRYATTYITNTQEQQQTLLIDPVTGLVTGTCEFCGRGSRDLDPQHKVCGNCRLCQSCGARPWTDKNSMRCDTCRCGDCGSRYLFKQITMRKDGKDVKQYVCAPCYAKRYPGSVCRNCASRKPVVRLRGHEKPRLCVECAFGVQLDGNRARHHCWWCGSSQGKRVDNKGRVICELCYTRAWCDENGCQPRRQCKKCRATQAHRDADAERDLAQAREDHMRVGTQAERNDIYEEPERPPFERPQHRLSRTNGGHIRGCLGCRWAQQNPQQEQVLAAWEREQHRLRTTRDRRALRPRPTTNGIMLERPGQVIFHKAGLSQFKRNKSHRYLGTEIEVCGYNETRTSLLNIRDTVQSLGGSIVHDGSLPVGGFEICTAASQGDLFIEHIEQITQALARGQATINEYAGLHVHVDCRDFTWDDMRKLLIAYSRLEPALIAMQPWQRVFLGSPGTGRQYCAPCGHKYADGIIRLSQPKEQYKSERKMSVLRNVYGITLPHRRTTGRRTVAGPPGRLLLDQRNAATATLMREAREAADAALFGTPRLEQAQAEEPTRVVIPRTDHYNAARYNALNVHSWFYRGTIECRMHEGTINGKEITNWGMLWAAIVDFAYRTPERTIITQMKAIPKPPTVRDPIFDQRMVVHTQEMRDLATENLMPIAPNAEVAAYIKSRIQKYATDHRSHN